MLVEFWAHHAAEHPNEDVHEDDDFDIDEVVSSMDPEAQPADEWEDVSVEPGS